MHFPRKLNVIVLQTVEKFGERRIHRKRRETQYAYREGSMARAKSRYIVASDSEGQAKPNLTRLFDACELVQIGT